MKEFYEATQLRVWEYTAGNFNKGTASRCHRQWLAFLHQQHWSGEELPFSLWLWQRSGYDKDGNLPPSAPTRGAAPFWDKNDLSLKTCLVSLCDKFEPIVLEGQLCVSLDLSQSGGKPTKSGKTKGLFLLLDPNQINTTDWWESRRLEERGAIFQGLHPYTCTAHHIWTRILWDKGFQENDWDNKLQAPIEMPCPQQRGMSDSEELGSNSNEMPMYSMGSADWPGPK